MAFGAPRLIAGVGPTNNSHQLVTKNESHLAVQRVGVMRITSACGSGGRRRAAVDGLVGRVNSRRRAVVGVQNQR